MLCVFQIVKKCARKESLFLQKPNEVEDFWLYNMDRRVELWTLLNSEESKATMEKEPIDYLSTIGPQVEWDIERDWNLCIFKGGTRRAKEALG
jgi:hypothetical protein